MWSCENTKSSQMKQAAWKETLPGSPDPSWVRGTIECLCSSPTDFRALKGKAQELRVLPPALSLEWQSQ